MHEEEHFISCTIYANSDPQVENFTEMEKAEGGRRKASKYGCGDIRERENCEASNVAPVYAEKDFVSCSQIEPLPQPNGPAIQAPANLGSKVYGSCPYPARR